MAAESVQITVTVPPSKIEEILRAHYKASGYDVENISFQVNSQTTGYGPAEHTTNEFDGAVLNVKQLPIPHSTK